MSPVGLQVPVAGSYSSAVATVTAEQRPQGAGGTVCPPATSTLPFASSVAVWSARTAAMLPVGLQVPVAGSYSSAPAPGPASRTLPVRSSVAVWPETKPGLPVGLQVPIAGSYSSAVASLTTRTLPEGNSVAVWKERALAMLPVGLQT